MIPYANILSWDRAGKPVGFFGNQNLGYPDGLTFQWGH
jgi:hypothetical protein